MERRHFYWKKPRHFSAKERIAVRKTLLEILESRGKRGVWRSEALDCVAKLATKEASYISLAAIELKAMVRGGYAIRLKSKDSADEIYVLTQKYYERKGKLEGNL